MKNLKVNLLYGLVVWVIPFIAGFVLYPLRNSDRVFFESLMQLTLVLVSVWCIVQVRNKSALHPWQTGVLWFLLCVTLDQLFFTWGPQKMLFSEYWKVIGVGYLSIPVIAWVSYTPVPVKPKTEEARENIEKVNGDLPVQNPLPSEE